LVGETNINSSTNKLLTKFVSVGNGTLEQSLRTNFRNDCF
jgi:hypothetical protein